jgi:hypothetical protein
LKKIKDLCIHGSSRFCQILYKEFYFLNLLSDLACSQIWLNHPADYRHFGYITNLMKKTIA